jgi:hypothetical protein
MIDQALQFLVSELNAFLLARTGLEFGKAELGRLVDDAGKWVAKENQVAVALLNVEEERALKTHTPHPSLVGGRQVMLAPELKLNLHVIFAANFQVYSQGLRQLSHVLTFFQAHPLFLQDEYPLLDAKLDRLAVDLMSLTYEQLNQVWAFIGGKQVPSVIYRVRMITLRDTEPHSIQPPVTTIVGDFGRR